MSDPTYERYEKGKQPCNKFMPSEIDFLPAGDVYAKHECPYCGGLRMSCANCHYDHHADGWDTCKPKKADMLPPEVSSEQRRRQ